MSALGSPLALAAGSGIAVLLAAFALRPAGRASRTAGEARAVDVARAGRRARDASVDERRDELIELLDAVARHVRTGLSLHAAVAEAVRSHPACLDPVPRLLRAGSTLGDALAAVPSAGPAVRRRGDRDEPFVVQTLSATLRSGGHLATPIERAATVLRERRAWRQERRAQSAQARLSALVMTLLPIGFAAWGVVASHDVRTAYATSPVAVVSTGIGLVLNALGWWWMRHLVGGRSP